MGQVTGYTVADYLLQHASRERRPARVPASTWDALLSHLRDPADAARLADSAHGRLLYRYAIPLYRRAADAGDGPPPRSWPSCWPAAATWTQLRARADAGDGPPPSAGRAAVQPRGPGPAARPGRRRRPVCRRAAGRAAGRRGDVDRLRARPTPATGRRRPEWPARPPWTRPGEATWTGCGPRPTPATGPPPSWPAAGPAAGDLDELRARADAGDRAAAWRLAGCWPSAGTWTSCAPGPTPATGPPPCSWPSCWPSAGTWTRPSSSCAPGPTPATSTPPCGWPSCWSTAGTWTSCAPGPTPATGMPPGGWPICWPSAGIWTSCGPGPPPGSWPSCWPSAGTWTSCAPGPTPATRTPPAAGRAAGRPRGPGPAARPGRRRRPVRQRPVAAGCWPICWSSAGTWTSCGPGPTPATGTPPRLAGLLAERGDLDELRARADAGDGTPPSLAGLLAERGDLDELRARADAGDELAAAELAELLAERGDLDRLRAGRRWDSGRAAPARPGRRRRRGRRRQLAEQLAGLLARRGQGEEAERLRRFGLNPDGSIACA